MKKKNPHNKVESDYGYPKGYNGAKELEEQATILREYQFPLKPLASVKTLPEGAEGLWVIPSIHDLAPSDCGHPYNYAVDFVLERLGKNRQFKNWRQGETGHLYLRQSERTIRLLDQLTLIQGEECTPVVPAQFGIKHRGESVDYAREAFTENEFGLGVFAIGCMLLTHPEREQFWEQLHLDCAGDEYAPDGDGGFALAPLWYCNDAKLHFGTFWTSRARGQYGSASGLLPQ